MAVAGLLNRLVGFAYRVLLVRLVGEEGVGLLQMLLPLWGLVATLASLGLPVALSRAVARHSAAGNWRAVAAVIARTATGLVASGATAAVGLWLAAPLIGRFVYSDPRVRTALLVLPAGVFVSTAAGTLRGYFHGRQNLVRVAAAQVVEQFVRVPAVLLLAAWLLPLGLGAAAAGAIAGMVAGEAAAAFYLLRALTQEQTHPRPWSRGGAAVERARDLLPVALPVMVGGLLTTISALADALLI
ncbi:MAG: oligosaccharide flippase family protein, partial [Clostridia bacterium]|nr:oligosaccharide flippase family protein [Clostridia bacterium]